MLCDGVEELARLLYTLDGNYPIFLHVPNLIKLRLFCPLTRFLPISSNIFIEGIGCLPQGQQHNIDVIMIKIWRQQPNSAPKNCLKHATNLNKGVWEIGAITVNTHSLLYSWNRILWRTRHIYIFIYKLEDGYSVI